MRLSWIVAPIGAVALGVGAIAWSAQDTPETDVYRELELFAEVLMTVKNQYVEPVDDREAMQAAIQGMLTSLDPHSDFLSAEDYRDVRVQTSGEYGGLGIEVTIENGIVKVVAPMDGTPAARAGIQPDDLIIGIDGESLVGVSLRDAVDKMRGPPGTQLRLTIQRADLDPFDITLTRERIDVDTVTARVEDGIAIVRVSAFNIKTGDDLRTTLRGLRRQELKGLVLDLRTNPGGLLDTAIEVSDAFLDGGEVVSTRGRASNQIVRYNATRGEILPDVPMVVLINGASASASEIVAGALQDRGRALVVGLTSYGKGSVQTLIELKNKRGALKLTTARYYTPSGRSIQGTGIEPDPGFEIANARIDPEKLKQAALFSEEAQPGALANEDGARRRAPHAPDEEPPEGWDPDKDYQLARAKELLNTGVVTAQLRQKRAGSPAAARAG